MSKDEIKEVGEKASEKTPAIAEDIEKGKEKTSYVTVVRLKALRNTLYCALIGVFATPIVCSFLYCFFGRELKLVENTLILVFGFIATSIVGAFIGSSFVEKKDRET